MCTSYVLPASDLSNTWVNTLPEKVEGFHENRYPVYSLDPETPVVEDPLFVGGCIDIAYNMFSCLYVSTLKWVIVPIL